MAQVLDMDFFQLRKMSKRKHSTDIGFRQPSKRPRTFSEPQLDGQITVVRELAPKPHKQATVKLIESANALGLNPLFVSNEGSSNSENAINETFPRLNPLFVCNENLESLGRVYDTCNGVGGSLKGGPNHTEPLPNLNQGKKNLAESRPTETSQSSDERTLVGPKDLSKKQQPPTDPLRGADEIPTFVSVFHQGDTSMQSADVQPAEELNIIDTNLPTQPLTTLSDCEVDISSNEMRTRRMAMTDSVEQAAEQSSAESVERSSQHTVIQTSAAEQIPLEQPIDVESNVEQSRTETSPKLPMPELETGERSIEDEQFVDEVKAALKSQGNWKTANVGRRAARRIRELLELAKPPNTSEALFLSGDDAAEQVRCGSYFPGPIITKDQQLLPLQTTTEFLEEFYDDTAKVWIQDPAITLARNVPHARITTIARLKQQFLKPSGKNRIPWNCLEMATHVEDGLRPKFLNGEDCRLLTKLKLPNTDDSVSRRGYEPGWKEVEKWALLAQGGALTEPHQDSHGYSTYITVNQGTMGFGWLSNPTAEERAEWRNAAATFTGGRWRFVVLRPGQTVFFPTGTVHFVFRLASLGDTLALGGHVLRCSQIVHWVETMLEEKAKPDLTNEELSVSAPAYLERVEKFVKQAQKNGQVERWGGADAIEKFLLLKAEFMSAD